MWGIPSFLRRRPPTLNQQKQRILSELERRFKKEQGATSRHYNKYVSNLVNKVLEEGGNARTIPLPNVKRMKRLDNRRENIGRILEGRFIVEQGRSKVRKELLNSLITSVMENNKNPNTMNLPRVANFSNKNFNPNNWTYVRENMKNTVRQYPGKSSRIIVRNTKNSPWRLATGDEIKKFTNLKAIYRNESRFK
jgi:hypothetical protein